MIRCVLRLLSLGALVVLCLGYDGQQTLETRSAGHEEQVRLCGLALLYTLRSKCAEHGGTTSTTNEYAKRDGENAMGLRRRATIYTYNQRLSRIGSLSLLRADPIMDADYDWYNPEDLPMLHKRAIDNGIVQECCLKPCSEYVLLAYCRQR